MPAIVVLGTQWGDEGKGKIVDYLAQKAETVVRYQGGRSYRCSRRCRIQAASYAIWYSL